MTKINRIPPAQIPFLPPCYQCRKAVLPFTLDGNVEKAFWDAAEFTEDFTNIEGKNMPKPRYRTRVKMLWDNENLYIGAIIEGDEIWAYVTERDDVIFQDNDFEVFIDPDSDTHEYYEFEMNARNTVWDLLLTKPYRDGGTPVNGWDIKGLQTAVHIDGVLNRASTENRRWMAEIVMPFQALIECDSEKKKPKEGDYYRINFSRVQWNVNINQTEYEKKTEP